MKNISRLFALLVALSAVNGAAFAQTVQPAIRPMPQIGPSITSTFTNCLVTCDTGAMNCQNSCLSVGPPTAANPAGGTQCTLNCGTQQQVCKQSCARSQ